MAIIAELGHNRGRRGGPMYALTFDLDTDTLKQIYPNSSWNNAYADIRRFLEQEGFEHKQGSVYFASDEDMDAVTCIAIVQDMSDQFPWLLPALQDIRMLRIEDNNDLMPALDRKRRRRR